VTDDPKLLEKVSLERPDLLETAEKDGILWEALDRLRPEYRQILLLFHFKDCPQQDISRFLGISVPTVKWRLMRTRTVLRRRAEDVVRDGPTEASRQRQKERIAAALPILAVVTREMALPTSVALFAVVRRGLAFGGALTLGLAGSLIYESQVFPGRSRDAGESALRSCFPVFDGRFVRRRFVPVCVDRLGRSRHGATSGRHRPAADLFVGAGSAAV